MSKNRVTHLCTELGMRPLEGSVAYCNRCGMCQAVCPTYRATQQEPFSPRGRNQALRLLLEGKLHPRRHRRELEPIVRSCLLCGKCTQSCPGHIPTPHHVLELGRRLQISLLPVLLKKLYRLRARRPALFDDAVRLACILNQAGLLRWVTCWPGFSFVKEMKYLLPASLQKPFRPAAEKNPTLFYLPSAEAESLCPDTARRVYELAAKKHCVRVWQHTPSGLFEYVYGDVRQARNQLRRLISRHTQ